MGARVSAKGVTPYKFGATDPAKQTASNKEAIALEVIAGKGMAAPPKPRAYPANQPGSKTKGTHLKGGSV